MPPVKQTPALRFGGQKSFSNLLETEISYHSAGRNPSPTLCNLQFLDQSAFLQSPKLRKLQTEQKRTEKKVH